VLSQVTEDYPTIILSDISPQDIKSIIEFIYHGEIRVPVENISSLLEAAQSLKISGLVDVSIKLLLVNYIFVTDFGIYKFICKFIIVACIFNR